MQIKLWEWSKEPSLQLFRANALPCFLLLLNYAFTAEISHKTISRRDKTVEDNGDMLL